MQNSQINQVSSYRQSCLNWRWEIPSHFNISADIVDRQLQLRGADQDMMGFVSDDGRYHRMTCAELLEQVCRVAAGFRHMGIDPGERVLIQLPNSFEFTWAFLGAMRAGLIPVPLSQQLVAEEIKYIKEDSGAALLLDHFAAIPMGESSSGYAERTRADDPAYMVYTSGTTGFPKGVLHAHRSLIGRDPAARYWLQCGQGDKVLHAGKMNWTFTLGTGLTDPLRHGAQILLQDLRYDPEKFLYLIEKYQVTHFIAVPSVFRHLLRDVKKKYDLRSLKFCLSAGDTLPAEMRQDFQGKFGKNIYEGMGMSEISYYIAQFPGEPMATESCGRPQPGHVIRVVDANGQAVLPGEMGQIAIRADDPGLFLQYWNDKALVRLSNGFFLTGDYCVQDANGYVVLKGRQDDIINSLGYRISPLESERILREHFAVNDAATVGWEIAPGKNLVVSLVEVKKEHSVSEKELVEFCENKLARYKSPKKIIFVPALPRTSNGKIRRSEAVQWLKDHFSQK